MIFKTLLLIAAVLGIAGASFGCVANMQTALRCQDAGGEWLVRSSTCVKPGSVINP